MFLFILTEASPNAFNEINSPLPRLTDLSEPLAGEWINDKHERFFDRCVLRWMKIGDFRLKDKARNAFYVRTELCATQNYKN